MKSPRTILGGLVAVAFLLPWAAPAVRASDTVLINFTDNRRDPDGTEIHAYAFAYNDWAAPHVRGFGRKGVLVEAQSGKGQLGDNQNFVKFYKTPTVYLHYVVGNQNEAKSISLVLTDADGTEARWTIPLEGKTKGADSICRMDLNNPEQFSKPGKKPGLDLKKITDWQIQGDWQDARTEVLLVKLVGEK